MRNFRVKWVTELHVTSREKLTSQNNLLTRQMQKKKTKNKPREFVQRSLKKKDFFFPSERHSVHHSAFLFCFLFLFFCIVVVLGCLVYSVIPYVDWASMLIRGNWSLGFNKLCERILVFGKHWFREFCKYSTFNFF